MYVLYVCMHVCERICMCVLAPPFKIMPPAIDSGVTW